MKNEVNGSRNAALTETGSIQGRVLNPVSQEYLANAEVRVVGTDLVAYTAQDGSYTLAKVPAGEVTLSASYTGYTVASASLQIEAARMSTHDFELTAAGYKKGKQAGRSDEPVMLQKFTVSAEAAGNAKAIMGERAALNAVNIVATDTYGDVTGGNLGEFIKYLPGIVLDYTEADARAARIGGLDPKYTAVSMDGMRMASAQSGAFGASSRQFEFEEASINSIETIEVHKTSMASMDADAPAGTINMISKNAFELSNRQISAQISATGNSYGMTLHKTPGPDDGNHLKVFPGAKFEYANSFGKRLGVYLSLSDSNLWNEQGTVTNTYSFADPTRGPVITSIAFKDGPAETRRSAAALNLDYKIADGFVFSLHTTGSHLDNEFINQNLTLGANIANVDPSSTLTHVVANATNNANTNLTDKLAHRHKYNDTVTYVPKLEFKRGDLSITAGGGYSRSRTHFEQMNSGFFDQITSKLTRMSWQADRSSTDSSVWQLTQLSGLPWGDPVSYDRSDANKNNMANRWQSSQSEVLAGYTDLKKTFNIAGLPVQFSTGLKSRKTTFHLEKNGTFSWTFVGPTGNQLDPSTVMITNVNHRFDPLQGGNIASLNLPYPNGAAMYDLYVAHPEQFLENTVGNYTAYLTGPRLVREQVDAGYVEANTRWKKFRFDLGVRNERTRTNGMSFDIVPPAVIKVQRPDLVAGTIPYIDYQYHDGQLASHYGSYDNTFLSGSVKYELTKNLDLQLGGSQSILRPDYNNLAGTISVNDNTEVVTLPNPELKPQTSNKYLVGARYFIEPAGTFSVDAYQIDVENMSVGKANVVAPPDYAADPNYSGYTFQQTVNAPGMQTVRGVDLEYSQRMVFLPGFWQGFSVFGSLSRTSSSIQVLNLVSKSANGGISYGNQRFNLQLRATWTSALLQSVNTDPNQDIWQNERIMFDLSGSLKLNQTYELTVSGRNIFNSPIRAYQGEPGLFRFNEYMGAIWTIGIRGRF